MHKLLQNKHFVNTLAAVIKHCATMTVLVILFFAAPDQHTSVLTAFAFIVGGPELRAKMGL